MRKLPREFDRDHLIARVVFDPTEEMWAHRLRATFAPGLTPPRLVNKSLAWTLATGSALSLLSVVVLALIGIVRSPASPQW
jgi:hypothetical protein